MDKLLIATITDYRSAKAVTSILAERGFFVLFVPPLVYHSIFYDWDALAWIKDKTINGIRIYQHPRA